MLNESKRPAVHSLRAQADKQVYEIHARQQNTDYLTIRWWWLRSQRRRSGECGTFKEEHGENGQRRAASGEKADHRRRKRNFGAIYKCRAQSFLQPAYISAQDASTGMSAIQKQDRTVCPGGEPSADSLKANRIEMYRYGRTPASR